jgi:hypothetical protein
VSLYSQSGRLGVGGSNPLAPTNIIKDLTGSPKASKIAQGNLGETFAQIAERRFDHFPSILIRSLRFSWMCGTLTQALFDRNGRNAECRI